MVEGYSKEELKEMQDAKQHLKKNNPFRIIDTKGMDTKTRNKLKEITYFHSVINY